MTVFQKMNLKDQDALLVLDAPASFEAELKSLEGVAVHRASGRVKSVAFFLAFVTSQPGADKAARTAAAKTAGDAVVWMAYPKGSSKRYTSSINRDSGWKLMGEAGFEPVRMVAIDEDWSAIRFRRADFIKTMTRGRAHAISAKGKAKATGTRTSDSRQGGGRTEAGPSARHAPPQARRPR
jgi:hypothetical protein